MPFDGDPGLFERVPSREEATSASDLQKFLVERSLDGSTVTITAGEDEIRIVPALANALIDLLGHLGSGKAVKLVPLQSQLTTQQAADLLNVSRPFLVKLIDEGALECVKVGRHRRLKAEDVFEYHEKMRADRSKALSEMAEFDAKSGAL